MVAERPFRSTLDVTVAGDVAEYTKKLIANVALLKRKENLAVDSQHAVSEREARTRDVCSAVELMEDWATDVENIATQRFETLAHEMKMTKVRLTELKDLKSQLRFEVLDNEQDQLSNTDTRIEAVEKSISELERGEGDRNSTETAFRGRESDCQQCCRDRVAQARRQQVERVPYIQVAAFATAHRRASR